MRLFIGVWLSETVRDEVAQFINRAKGQISECKWSAPEQLHFTLKFLGETPEKELHRLSEALKGVTVGLSSFELRLGKPGYFPERGNPRILWIGLSKGEKDLGHLAGLIEAACVQAGFPAADRPFKPHLTIARAKEGQRGLSTFNPAVAWQSETLVTGFSLIESKLRPGGAVYRNVREFLFI
jgi:2'-5' RNA ligase